MHLRLHTAISPLSGSEFSYHHVTQAGKTQTHTESRTTYIPLIICKYTTPVTAVMEAAMDNLLAPVQNLFEGQIVSRYPSAQGRTIHARPLLLIWCLSCWIGFPRSTNRGVTFYCSFNYFRGWCCPMPFLVLALFIVYLDTNCSLLLFRSARLSSDTSTKTFTSLFGLDWLELSWPLLLSSPLGLFTIRTPRNGSSPQLGGQPTQESW